MAKYRIKVEVVDGNEKLNDEYIEGIEADGFVIMTDTEEKARVALHNINIDTIANIMMKSTEILSAGVLAKARKDVIDIAMKAKKEEMFSKLIGLED